jgi:hypothetical protein
MSATNQQRVAVSRQTFWRQHIADCEHSPLNQRQYCNTNGLALSTFSYWKKKLGKKAKKNPRFYPLTVPQLSSSNNQADHSGLSLTLNSSKFRIEFAENFSASCLKKLILTLEQL